MKQVTKLIPMINKLGFVILLSENILLEYQMQ